MNRLVIELKKVADTVNVERTDETLGNINNGMYWDETPQGRHYWVHVHRNLQAILYIKNIIRYLETPQHNTENPEGGED